MREEITIRRLMEMKSLVDQGLNAFGESPEALGKLLDVSWDLKKKLATGITNSYVDSTYDSLIQNGFYGGKLLGAGGSGYLLMVGPSRIVKNLHESEKFSTLKVSLDTEGSTVIYNS